MSNDGLSQSEKVNLLFKNYMSFTTTADSKQFFEETSLPNNDNIFSNNILTNAPPANPTYSTVANVGDLESYLVYSGFTDISIDATWFTNKTTDGGTFGVNSTTDTDRTVLRLNKIKLDYLGSGSAAFVCKDNNGVNILQNLIPSNYSTSGYSLSLHYKIGGVLKPIGWLATRDELAGAGFVGSAVNFGGALFDSKNGVVTFYDVNGTASTVFANTDFYLTATKYIGIKGISTIGTGGTKVESTPDNKLNLVTDGMLRFTIDASGNSTFVSSDPSYVAIDISATSGLLLPKGTTNQRPLGNPDLSGVIRYNTETQQFEGYATAWQGLGGVIDVDQDTKITAEDNPNDDNDELKFFTAGIKRMTIGSTGSFDISGPTTITNTLGVSGSVDLDGTLGVGGATRLETTLDVSGATVLDSTLNVKSDLKINTDKFTINATTGNARTLGTLDVSGAVDLDSTLDVAGATHLETTLDVSGATVLDSTLDVKDDFKINTNKFTVASGTGNTVIAGTLDVTGATGIDGDFDVGGTEFTVKAASGNTRTLGTLDVSGAVDLDNTLDVAGATHLETTLDVSGATVLDSTLDVKDDFKINTNKFTVASGTGNTVIAGTLDVTGATGIDGDFDVGGTEFTVKAASGNTRTLGTLDVSGAVDLDSTLDVAGATHIETTLDVSGATVLDSTLDVKDDFKINTNKFTVASGTGNTVIAGTLDVTGATGIDGDFDVGGTEFTVKAASGNTRTLGTLDVSGAVDLDSTLDVAGATHLETTLDVSGATVLDSTLDVKDDFKINTNKFTVASGTGNTVVAGTMSVSDDFDVGGTNFTVKTATGNTRTLGTLGVSGAVDLDSTLDVAGSTRLATTLDVSGATVLDSTLSVTGNTTLGGNLFGPATFYIDPSPINDDAGTVVVRGNLQIDGTTTTINSTTVDVSDLTIKLGSNSSSQSQSDGAGIEVNHGGSFLYDSAANIWKLDVGQDVSGTLNVKAKTTLEADFDVGSANFTVASGTGNTAIAGTLDVTGAVGVDGDFDVGGTEFTVKAASGDTRTLGTLGVSGAVDLDSTLNVEGAVDLASTLGVAGATRLETTLDVSGATVLDSTLNVKNNLIVNTDKFTIAASSGNTRTLGTLDVSGQTLIDNSLIVLGNIGININDPTCALDISNNDALRIPVGTTGQRPDVVKTGQIRFNTTTSQFEGYNNNSSWQGLGGVVDIDQDTKILAESNPLDDNDEIQIFTDGVERMRVDASGNIQFKQSDNRYIALDVSATSGIMLPKGTKSERPVGGTGTIRSDISGTIRYNTDTSLCEMYTASEIWSAFPVYKTDQPPKLLNISKSPLSESVSVSWTKFQEIYKDVFDGKSYPIYLQTFVDISFTSINGESSNGWKTVLIGNGNYNSSGVETTPLTSINFNSVVETTYSNPTSYDISFVNKPSTDNLPVFTQDDSFDLRVYGVNNSGTLPNYIYMYGVALKQTAAPGPVTVSNTDTFTKSSLTMDFAFDLDSNDSSITSGISIVHYDISYALSGTKSLVSRSDSGNLPKHWSEPTDLGKSNISLTGLIPGAKYDIEVRAKNALKFNAGGVSDGDPPTDLYKYGTFGSILTSTGFTNDSGQSDGLSTTRYVDTGDLGTVDPDAMTFTLNNSRSIDCHIAGTNNRTARTIMNSTSDIGISSNSSFYVNYGKQGSDMNDAADALVSATFTANNATSAAASTTVTQTMNFIQKTDYEINGALTATLGSYTFISSASYTDQGTSTNVMGFVYGVSFENNSGNGVNAAFTADFTPSTNTYYLNYSITSQTYNNGERIEQSGDVSSGIITTGNFCVDDYSNTPTITFTSDPAITVTSEVYLFGIPSVRAVNATAQFQVSNFAAYIIPYENNRHSRVASISKNCYSFLNLDESSIYETTAYTTNYNYTDSSISTGCYDANTTSDFTITVYYLNNSGTPTVTTKTDNTKDILDIGHVFRDTEDSYSAFDLHVFNGTDTITTGSAIDVDNTSFATTYSGSISSMLIRFNGKFVSGGFSASYSSTSISPFSDWSSGYAVTGPDYSSHTDTGVGGFKWIAVNVTSKKSGNNVDLSNFLINGAVPVLGEFGNAAHTDGYEAYISHDGKFGALNSVSNSGATLWFNESSNSTIADAKTNNGALQNNGTDAFIDSTTSSQIYLVVGLPQNGSGYFTFT